MSDIAPQQRIDLKGVVCPLNFVKTKVQLEAMRDGEILEILLDDGEPIQNVPRAIKEEGHKIVKVEQLPDTSYRLLIKKGGYDAG